MATNSYANSYANGGNAVPLLPFGTPSGGGAGGGKRGAATPWGTVCLAFALCVQSSFIVVVLLRQRAHNELHAAGLLPSVNGEGGGMGGPVYTKAVPAVSPTVASCPLHTTTTTEPTDRERLLTLPPPTSKRKPSHAASHSGSMGAAAASEDDDVDLIELDGAIRRRFTDMSCNLYGDETELCVYEHVICYDGQYVTLSVPTAPLASPADPTRLGLVLGDPTGGCFDYRYYEPASLEYNNCKYDVFPFKRQLRYPNGPKVFTESPRPSPSPVEEGAEGGRADGWGAPVLAAPPSSRAAAQASPTPPPLAAQWPLPLLHRRWGPLNRGSTRFREVTDTDLFGPRPPGMLADGKHGGIAVTDPRAAAAAFATGAALSAVPPGTFYPGFKAEGDDMLRRLKAAGVGVESVTRTAAFASIYWADGPLWFAAMDG